MVAIHPLPASSLLYEQRFSAIFESLCIYFHSKIFCNKNLFYLFIFIYFFIDNSEIVKKKRLFACFCLQLLEAFTRQRKNRRETQTAPYLPLKRENSDIFPAVLFLAQRRNSGRHQEHVECDQTSAGNMMICSYQLFPHRWKVVKYNNNKFFSSAKDT